MRGTRFLPALALVVLACDSLASIPAADIDVSDAGFTPSVYNVLGTDTIVTWRWSSGRHNVTFEDGAPGSGDYVLGTFERNFAPVAAGTYRYRCSLHTTTFAGAEVGSIVKP